jgi:hypothetical protein
MEEKIAHDSDYKQIFDKIKWEYLKNFQKSTWMSP